MMSIGTQELLIGFDDPVVGWINSLIPLPRLYSGWYFLKGATSLAVCTAALIALHRYYRRSPCSNPQLQPTSTTRFLESNKLVVIPSPRRKSPAKPSKRLPLPGKIHLSSNTAVVSFVESDSEEENAFSEGMTMMTADEGIEEEQTEAEFSLTFESESDFSGTEQEAELICLDDMGLGTRSVVIDLNKEETHKGRAQNLEESYTLEERSETLDKRSYTLERSQDVNRQVCQVSLDTSQHNGMVITKAVVTIG